MFFLFVLRRYDAGHNIIVKESSVVECCLLIQRVICRDLAWPRATLTRVV